MFQQSISKYLVEFATSTFSLFSKLWTFCFVCLFYHDFFLWFCFSSSDVWLLLSFEVNSKVLFSHVELCICRWGAGVIEVKFFTQNWRICFKGFFLSVSCNMLEVVHVERSFVFQLSFLGQVLLIFSNFLIHTFLYTSKIYCKDLMIFYRYIIFLASFYFFRNIFSMLYFCFPIALLYHI